MTGSVILYESRLNDATPAASSVASGFDVLNLRDLRDYTFWKPTALPATVTVNHGAAKTFDYLAIYNHNLGSLGCTVELRRSTDNFVANDVLVATHTPTDDEPILLLFAQQNFQYSRLRITGPAAPTIAIALWGNKLEIPSNPNIREGFDPLGRAIKSAINRSNTGRALGRVINWREWKQTLIFELVTWTWLRSTWLPAAKAWLESEPWLFCWNPDLYPKETYHVTMDEAGWDGPHKASSQADLTVPVTGRIPV